MRISHVTALTIKAQHQYRHTRQARETDTLPSSEYLYYEPYRELYAKRTEATLVRVETDKGLVGWGEAQSPIAPEVSQTIVAKVLAPVVLGKDPLETNVRFHEMYGSLRARGQTAGFQLDAIAAVDTALWDLKGQALGQSVSRLLGGSFRDRLPCYVSGLLGSTPEERADEAVGWIDRGFGGVKVFLGYGVERDGDDVEALAAAVGERGEVHVDVLWRYDQPSALRLGRVLERHGRGFLEAPLLPEDVEGHAALVRQLDAPVAVGEPLRGRHQFLPWFRSRALDVCQPDVMRNGISETFAIAHLAEAFNIPVALHNGAATVVGMAATWQTAAAISNYYSQEFEPRMLELFNPWLREPLLVEDGQLVVPAGPGLGISVDEDRLREDVDSALVVNLGGKR